MTDRIHVYCDGACKPNPGAGGWGCVIDGVGARRELSGGFRRTTNNRMEIWSVIEGLRAVPGGVAVTVVSDSKYVVDMMTGGHVRRWKRNHWMRTRKERALNPDLWDRLLSLCDGRDVDFQWVRGHDGHPENERADVLAAEAARREGLPADEGFEEPVAMDGPTLFDLVHD